MSSNLDRSLDEILAASRPARRGAKGAAPSGPAGGVRKRSQRVAAQKANVSVTPNAAKAAKAVPTGPSGKVSASKIIVSNLPYDVSEPMIKEYFQSVVGPVRRATLTYGPNGQSRGIATVEFVKPEHAALAAQRYHGVEVDSRPMKVELVIDANAPAAPSFADRVGTPNKIITAKPRADKPKPAAKAATTPRGRGTNARGKRGGRSGNAARPKAKTAEQLDQEMADYFGGDSNNATAAPAATAAANGGDADMDDTVLVGTP